MKKNRTRTEQEFLRGYCGTYALALYDLSGGRFKLGMLRGIREDEDVNIHSFVFHPKKKDLVLDAGGSNKISDIDNDWKDSHLNSEQMHLELDSYVETYENREEFLLALEQTGHPVITDKDYGDAVRHIMKNHNKLIKNKPLKK